MKKLLFCIALLPTISIGQIFQENWDGNGPGIAAWTLIDVDGNTPNASLDYINGAWTRVDRGGPEPNFGGPDGNYAVVSTSWYTPAGTANDWLISPAVNLAGVTSAYFTWDAKAQDNDYPDGYNVMLAPNGGNTIADFTVQLFSTNGENPYWTTRTTNISAYAGQTVRIAFVNNSTDKFVLVVDNITITEEEVDVPIAYCPITFGIVEAISFVNFAGINNVTDANEEDVAYENYTTLTGNVIPGESYSIILKGNTAGDFDNYFTVFADWNQDGNFNGDDETYQIGFITNSNGVDTEQAEGSIAVPEDALTGSTRMRVVKNYDEPIASPCEVGDDFSFGQAEDYTLIVGTLGLEGFASSGFMLYPNPAVNYINISGSNDIKEIAVYNLLGQEVIRKQGGEDNNSVNVSALGSGTYIARITTGTATQNIKFVKQ